MWNMKFPAFAAVFACALAASPAFATTIYDSTLAVPAGGTTSVYFNPNSSDGDWTVDTESDGIELGLRSALGFGSNGSTGSLITPVGDTYTVPTGGSYQTAWDFEFSIDLDPSTYSGGTGLDFSQVNTLLTMTDLTTEAQVFSVGAFDTLVGGYEVGTESGNSTPLVGQSLTGTVWAYQAAFNGYFGPNPVDPNSTDQYQFTLNVTSKSGGALLASDTILVDPATPEPSTWLLLASGLGAVFVFRSRQARRPSGLAERTVSANPSAA